MELKSFEKVLKNKNFVRISDGLLLFSDIELYDSKRDVSEHFRSIDELVKAHPEIGEIISDEKFSADIALDGGRGSSSLSGRMGGGFGHAPDLPGNGVSLGRTLYPATFNAVSSSSKTIDSTVKQFADAYKNADHEYAVTIEPSGFVTRHVEGDAHSVAISGGENELVVHNHPGGGNFSDSDLLNVAQTGSRGIVAVGNEKTYTFQTGKNFNASGFAKAVGRAKWPVEYDYDKGADWWLRRNAKTFGYTYSARATK